MSSLSVVSPMRLLTFVVVASLGASASAQYETTDPRLPSGHYVGPNEDTFYDNNCRASFFDVFFDVFDRVTPPAPGFVVDSFFDITYRIDFDGATGGLAPELGSSTAHLRIQNDGTGSGAHSFFDIEILSLDLHSLQPVMIRESPTQQSTGKTHIQDLGGGHYVIDSFFDVFTEISWDGGQSWGRSMGSTLLTGVPEPASAAVLGLGFFALARRRR